MGRKVHGWMPIRVADATIAPHRYKWNEEDTSPGDDAPISEWRKSVPYQPGEVVYVNFGDGPKRARIYSVMPGRNRYGERVETFRVQLENRHGLFSRVWVYAWPGSIQRGYHSMGLAPDIPAGVL